VNWADRIAFDLRGDLKNAAIAIYPFRDKKKTVMDVIKL
jgi:branched-chain amino acid transport system substrate-binding protein